MTYDEPVSLLTVFDKLLNKWESKMSKGFQRERIASCNQKCSAGCFRGTAIAWLFLLVGMPSRFFPFFAAKRAQLDPLASLVHGFSFGESYRLRHPQTILGSTSWYIDMQRKGSHDATRTRKGSSSLEMLIEDLKDGVMSMFHHCWCFHSRNWMVNSTG